ncbi:MULTISPECIES: class I SAM-dependent methyltransferase [Paraburkholderia]|uniref:class I SAM-dependent methyltransferase n=1 Tax=Paraburkholderia TaxID=1822464 RepID=UPI000361DAB4|nr:MULTISPECIES: class I SAM-dependent methyltransferase [Paraburkholderia]MDH6149466.1 SAM-dependent methyltransferase [Paraburkholderia sp. WSM4179]
MGQLDFSAFEHEGWERVAQAYHTYFGDLTTQSNHAMLETLCLQRGARFLDVACGPGYLAAAAARCGADVAGVDFSVAMVEKARRVFPGLEFRVGDAEDLPFPDESFASVGISFALLLHFPHPERALAEAFRVPQPNGRIAFTVWATPEKAVGFAMVLKAIEKHGTTDVPVPPGPPFFRFSDWQESARVLLDAGFVQPGVRELDLTLVLHAPDTPSHALIRGGVRFAALLNAQTSAALKSIERAVVHDAEAYRSDGGELRLPMSCVLASALKTLGDADLSERARG